MVAVYTVTLRADAAKYPVLLANGNLVETGSLDNGRHFATWHDPPSPSPAICLPSWLATWSRASSASAPGRGRPSAAGLAWRRGDLEKTEHAMNSLVASIVWDEARFGLPLDLERFMVVGGPTSTWVRWRTRASTSSTPAPCSPRRPRPRMLTLRASSPSSRTSTSTTGRATASPAATGSSSLKEGLTVFRDQEFSMDMAGSPSARVVCRIRNVRALRAPQFPEDSGAMAHPVRPDSYSEINNFYTATVYEKGLRWCG